MAPFHNQAHRPLVLSLLCRLCSFGSGVFVDGPLQMFEMSKLCEELVKDHEAHQNSVSECVRESRKALAAMKKTSPKFASILVGRNI